MGEAVGALGSQRVPGVRLGAKPDAVDKVAKEFEAVFLTQVFDQMFDTVSQGSFGGGYAEETWKSFLAHEYAKSVAETGATGISQSLSSMIKSYDRAKAIGQ